jgi:hypothetical protein
LRGTRNRNCIEPLEMEMKDESAVKSAIQDMTASVVDHDLSAESSASLKEIAAQFRGGVEVKTLRYHLKTYHNAFTGKDAVDFLVNEGFASSRTHAVTIGRRLAKELKVFDHVTGKHEFKDEGLYYVFLTYDGNTYAITTHRPWGKPLFWMLGFLPEKVPSEAEAHLEMPYSNGVDHPRFTVKESLVIRSKESQKLLLQELEDADADVDTAAEPTNKSEEQLAKGLDDFLDEDDEEDDEGGGKSTELMLEEELAEDDGFVTEIKILKPPPQQDIDFKKKGGDKKITDVLAEARHKVHGVLLHMFNDRVFKMDAEQKTAGEKSAQSGSKEGIGGTSGIGASVRARGSPQRGSKHKSYRTRDEPKPAKAKPGKDTVAARKDEYNKLLGIDKYSHGNPWIAKVGVIVQPICEIALEWLCLFRALFNVFTWRDPILSFWVSIIGPILVVVLHLFPWRWVMLIAGLFLLGPQNWLLRVMRERKKGYEPADPDKLIKKKRIKKETVLEPEELPLFSMHAPNNRPLDNADIDQSSVRKIVVPYSPLMYQRFYDWPPENEYARVIAEGPPTSDPDIVARMKSYISGDESIVSTSSRSRWAGPRRIVKGLSRMRRRKKNGSETSIQEIPTSFS